MEAADLKQGRLYAEAWCSGKNTDAEWAGTWVVNLIDEVERLQAVLRTQVRVNVSYTSREVDQWQPLLKVARDIDSYSCTDVPPLFRDRLRKCVDGCKEKS